MNYTANSGWQAALQKWGTLIQAARLTDMVRSPRQIISWPEYPAALAPRIVIFMHFDRRGRVSAPALGYIRELIRNGYCVAFVTNSGKLTPAARTELQQICAAIFVRRNISYDFGAWRQLIEA